MPKLYVECGHGSAPGVSITKLLTGLRCGGTSAELKLSAAYLASEHSYGKASRDLGVHHGQAVERTMVRRMACDYVRAASTVLAGFDTKRWSKEMRDAIWKRDIRQRDKLLEKARGHRARQLSVHLDKCPLDALTTYLSNNWQHMQAARLKELGVD